MENRCVQKVKKNQKVMKYLIKQKIIEILYDYVKAYIHTHIFRESWLEVIVLTRETFVAHIICLSSCLGRQRWCPSIGLS